MSPNSQQPSFKDHFSARAAEYARHRPRYPRELFEFVVSLPRRRRLAWDCGTGSGQAAVALAEHFEEVVATDASRDQLARAEAHPRVRYRAVAAEASGLNAASVDLVTVAQAIHWFDFDAFYREVGRVLRPDGVLAAWCYGTFRGEPGVDDVLARFYDGVVGPYWPPERRLIDEEYRTLPFPFEEIPAPGFEMTVEWSLENLEGYLGTWSACQKYRRVTGRDPVELIHLELATAWGDPARLRKLVWPLHLRLGRAGTVQPR